MCWICYFKLPFSNIKSMCNYWLAYEMNVIQHPAWWSFDSYRVPLFIHILAVICAAFHVTEYEYMFLKRVHKSLDLILNSVKTEFIIDIKKWIFKRGQLIVFLMHHPVKLTLQPSVVRKSGPPRFVDADKKASLLRLWVNKERGQACK